MDYRTEAPPLIRDFLVYHETIQGHSRQTVDEYYLDLRSFARYLKQARDPSLRAVPMDHIPLDDVSLELFQSVTLTDVYSYMNFLTRDKGLNAASRARKVATIRSFYKYLTNKAKLLTKNPVQDLDSPRQKKSLPKYLSLDESIDLLESVDGKNATRDFCILTLFLNCGMRLTELVTINMGDFKQDTIRITGKGNKERLVYLNDACLEALDHYKKARAALPNLPADERALFVSKRTGKRLTARRVEQIVARCLQSAGLSGRGFSPHKLRHTAATLMYQGGVDMLALKEILGHESVSTTQIYTHINQERLRAAVKASPLADQGYIAESKPSQQDSGEED